MDLPNPGIKRGSPALHADSLSTELRLKSKKKTLKFAWKQRKTQIAKTTLRKENRARESRFPNFALCYKAIVIKTVYYWQKERLVDQWNRIESAEINSHSYCHLIYDRAGKNIQ